MLNFDMLCKVFLLGGGGGILVKPYPTKATPHAAVTTTIGAEQMVGRTWDCMDSTVLHPPCALKTSWFQVTWMGFQVTTGL